MNNEAPIVDVAISELTTESALPAMQGHISSVLIRNFKSFAGDFLLEMQPGINILVGDNEVGKSSILEAIHLALSGLFQGKNISYDLTQDIFNKSAVEAYLSSVQSGKPVEPPSILIELYFEGISDQGVRALLEGDGNSTRKKACGIALHIGLTDAHKELYEEFLKQGNVGSLPIEYFECRWSTFARDETLRPSTLPIKSALIDSSANRYQNGSDIYISRIVKDYLSRSQHIKVSQAHRKLKENFNQDPSIHEINTTIQGSIDISSKAVTLSVDLSSKNAWESSLTTYIDGIPFHLIGKGEQTTIKTKLALSHKKATEANILLLEEPENHLSHTNLNSFIKYVSSSHGGKQIIVTTHSSFVANKLGLDSLILLSPSKGYSTIRDLKLDTKDYFSKLSGFDTLRLILCKKAILVEGPSDELVVQRAYMDTHSKRLPIEDRIEVISVGTSFLRFLEIAKPLNIPVAVVTDNDGAIAQLKKKYQDYEGIKGIKILYDQTEDSGALKKFNYNTLEPKLLKVNGREKLNKVFGTNFTNDDDLLLYMKANKTECALTIFGSPESIVYPRYITDALNDNEQE